MLFQVFYFSNSPLAANGLPRGGELEVLEAYRGRIPERVFSEPISIPSTDGSGWARDNLRRAFTLLEAAGWTVRDMKLVNAEGEQFHFEILLYSRAFERIMLPWVRNLRRLGMDVSLRLVDTAQYINRVRSFDYDALVLTLGQSENPGNEQRNFWSSAAADQPGSRNYAGIRDEVIDELVERIIQSPDRESLTDNVRALDRILLNSFYVVPNWHLAADRILYWDKFGRPDIPLRNGVNTNRWWFDADKVSRLEQALQAEDLEQPANGNTARNTWILIGVLLLGGWMLKRYFRRPDSQVERGN